jgi:hypothetical protein
VPELRRPLWCLVWVRPPAPAHILAWSLWRRRHQQRARRCHWQRRTRHRKLHPDYPLVRLDEVSKQLLAETRTPIPMQPGRVVRADYEYQRNGINNLFMAFAPLEGRRHVTVTIGERRLITLACLKT